MILMRMGNQHLTDGVAVLLRGLHDAFDLPGWIDHGCLPGGRVTDEIYIVLHRSTFQLFQVECVSHPLSPASIFTIVHQTLDRARSISSAPAVSIIACTGRGHYTAFSLRC